MAIDAEVETVTHRPRSDHRSPLREVIASVMGGALVRERDDHQGNELHRVVVTPNSARSILQHESSYVRFRLLAFGVRAPSRTAKRSRSAVLRGIIAGRSAANVSATAAPASGLVSCSFVGPANAGWYSPT